MTMPVKIEPVGLLNYNKEKKGKIESLYDKLIYYYNRRVIYKELST